MCRGIIFDDLNFSRRKEDLKELLFSKCQRWWWTLEADKKESIQQSIQKTGLWHVAGKEWGEKMEKDCYDLVGGADRLLVTLSLINLNLVVYLGYSIIGCLFRVVHKVAYRVVGRVVCGVGSVGTLQSWGQSFQLFDFHCLINARAINQRRCVSYPILAVPSEHYVTIKHFRW